MKNLVLMLALGSLAACNSVKMVGNDKDNHGCKESAGQTWSELKQNCIQVFNEGTRLNPINAQKDGAVISAFLVFNGDQSKAELFLTDKPNVILKKTQNGNYTSGKYVYSSSDSTLYIDGKAVYKK